MTTARHRARSPRAGAGEWVLLTYRLPREPSTLRSAVWRKLRKLGVAQIGDGLVGLPTGPRSREQLEWVAEEVTDAGGAAGMWLAPRRPAPTKTSWSRRWPPPAAPSTRH